MPDVTDAFDFALMVKAIRERDEAHAELERLRAALDSIMHELGVPQPDYPAPVSNAYRIAEAALREAAAPAR